MSENTNLVKLEQILELAEQYEELEITTIGKDTGKEFDVQFYPHFSSDKIDNLMQELGDFANSKDKDSQPFVELINSSEENFMRIIYFFIIKEFTHIGEDMKQKETPAELFPYFEALVKTGYLAELIEDVFLAEELQKVFKRVADIGALNEHMNQIGFQFFDSLAEHEDKISRIQELRNKKK